MTIDVSLPPRAVALLDRIETSRVTTVTAPVGGGHTQAVATWLAARRKRYARVDAEVRRDARQHARLRHLIEAPLATRRGLVVWYHDDPRPECSDELGTLLTDPTIRMVVTGNEVPAPLRLAGDAVGTPVASVTADQLAWTADDVAAALVGHRDVADVAATAQAVVAWSDGWPLAVTVALADPSDLPACEQRLAPELDQIMAGWPAEVAERLASVADRGELGPEELHAALDVADPHAVLRRWGVPARWTRDGSCRLNPLLARRLSTRAPRTHTAAPVARTDEPVHAPAELVTGHLHAALSRVGRPSEDLVPGLGRPDEALRAFLDVLTGSVRTGLANASGVVARATRPETATWAHLARATALVLRGEISLAADALAQVHLDRDASETTSLEAALVARLEAEIALYQGRESDARHLLLTELATAPTGRFAHELLVTGLVETSLARGSLTSLDHDLDRLRSLVPPVSDGVRTLYDARAQLAHGDPAAALATATGCPGQVSPLLQIALDTIAAVAAGQAQDVMQSLVLHQRVGAAAAKAGLDTPDAWHVRQAVMLSQGARLTAAEQKALRLLASDLSLGEVAAALLVSPNTLKTHTRHIYRKLGVRNRVEAAERARALGIAEL